MDPFHFTSGERALLVSMPHVGTEVPEAIRARFTDAAAALPDTDWHVDRLYDFLGELGCSRIAATHSRYVVDLNRRADDRSLYPGSDVTGLCPLDTFDEEPIYRPGMEPDAAEIAERVERYWKPYRSRLKQELIRLREQFGRVVLWDAHSIRSAVPRFFDGRLPDLNIGTAEGASAAEALVEQLAAIAAESPYSHVVNGRFTGGAITRTYGNPEDDFHAVQLELSQATYMEEAAPYRFREDLAEQVRPTLKAMLTACLEWAEAGP